MRYRSDYPPDEKLLRKLTIKILKIILGGVILVGKPFFFLFLTLAILANYIYYITGHPLKRLWKNTFSRKTLTYLSQISQIYPKSAKKFPKQKLKKRGIVFSTSKHKIKLSLQKKVAVFAKQIRMAPGKSKTLSWKTHVFFLAVEKLLTKLLKELKRFLSYLRPLDKVSILHFGIKLKLLGFYRAFPKPRPDKINKLRTKLTFLNLLAFSFGFSFTLGFVGILLFWLLIINDLPPVDKLTQRDVQVSTKIYDRNGRLLYSIYKDKNRTPIPLSEIPPQVKYATIAIEDSEFYSHPGFSIRGITRALTGYINGARISGGSTITQQLVKNAYLTPERTLIRKIKEITLAVLVEQKYTKDEILEMYLNEVSYGGTSYGIQEAARVYFGKDAGDLTLSEAALLAGLPRSPTQLSPFGNNPERAINRKKEVLNLMQANGFITKAQRIKAEEEALVFAQNRTGIEAPHFVMYVREELEEKFGKVMVEKGGLNVITSLDLSIQKLAEEVVAEEIEKLERLNVTNASVLVINPGTGEILAMVGSVNYFDTEKDGNVNVTLRPRQPGSAIKVITYALALSNGYTPLTIIPDTPVTYHVHGAAPYSPRNYEGGYRGNLTLRSALAESRNVPAVKVLNSLGVDNMIKLGQKMGITTWNQPESFGLSLTLGGGEVKLIDLAGVYATIANYGQRPEITGVVKVSNFRGNTISRNPCTQTTPDIDFQIAGIYASDGENKTDPFLEKLTKPLIKESSASETAFVNPRAGEICFQEEVIDPRVAFIITDILKDNNARAPAFGTNSLLNIPNHKEVAVKTGTSNNLRDNLAIGYNQDYLIAVWVGNNDNSPMARIASGVTGATPIFHKIMSTLLAKEENHDWEMPEGLVQLPVCPLTETLACRECPVVFEWFLEENRPDTVCRPEWFTTREEESASESN